MITLLLIEAPLKYKIDLPSIKRRLYHHQQQGSSSEGRFELDEQYLLNMGENRSFGQTYAKLVT